MQMLFKELDQAFICTMELRSDALRDDPYIETPRSHRLVQNAHGLIGVNASETLERLHGRLMLLANEERYSEALGVIQRMLDLVTEELGISRDATKLNSSHVGHAVMKSMTLFRFHLQLIKTEAYLHSQIGNLDAAKTALEKVLEFDGSNRLGARELLESLPSYLNS